MLSNFFTLILFSSITVLTVRKLLIHGIEIVCWKLSLSNKAKGQIIGFTTSIPELTVIISSALSGVFSVGFWNIASSNIINWFLFLSAVLFYRQQKELFKATFIDEIAFGLLSVAIPAIMFLKKVEFTSGIALILVVFFIIYKTIDHYANLKQKGVAITSLVHGRMRKGIFFIVAGSIIITISGHFIGQSSYELIRIVGIPAWLIGWILGVITSIPELTSFFEIYSLHKKRGTLHYISDTQEALDALVFSNMSNLGLILPVGMLIFAISSNAL
ncbi:hypothetical protein JXJ21_18630 [candidate division KSB1 bacterium]|nr:hypothetical protein [candidate division KSB1 bacterium]